jgi:hypothetical protein
VTLCCPLDWYIFGILTIEYNNSLLEVKEALLHIDKFSTSSLSDRMIRVWIRSVHWKTVITLKRYEELGWGRRFFVDVQDLPQCRTLGCQALIFRNVWEHERWMTSCSRTCRWRHEHQMFAATLSNSPTMMYSEMCLLARFLMQSLIIRRSLYYAIT